MKKILKGDMNKMNKLKAKFEIVESNWDINDLRKNFPIFSYVKTKEDEEVALQYFGSYFNQLHNNPDLNVKHLNIKKMRENMEKQTKEINVKFNLDKIFQVQNLEQFEEIYSDWTNQLIGWELTIDNGEKLLFQKDSEEILTTDDNPINLLEDKVLKTLIDNEIIIIDLDN